MNFAKLFAAAIIVTGFFAGTAYAAADPNGTWNWTFKTQNGQDIKLSLTLKADGDKLSGTLALPQDNKIDIKDGTFKDDEVSFSTSFERNGTTFVTKFKGKVEGDTIKGTTERERNGEVMKRDWEAKREKK